MGDRVAGVARQDGGARGVPRLASVGSCPICAARDSKVLFRSPDLLLGVPGWFTYRRCVSCRTVFQDPRVTAEDIPLCYPDGYYTHLTGKAAPGPRGEGQWPARRLARLRDQAREAIVDALLEPRHATWRGGLGSLLARLRGLRERAFFGLLDELIPRHLGPARALDVGCGAGHLMAVLVRAGWAVEGLEPDPVAAEVARRYSACRVTVGDLLTADLPTGTFGLVVLSHVFEHLADPNAALRRIAGLLAPTGRAVLIYPNPEGLGARLLRDVWTEWDPPRHLTLPPVEAICGAVRRHGLRSVSARTVTRGSRGFEWSRKVAAGLFPSTAGGGLIGTLLHSLSSLAPRAGLPLGEEIVVSIEREHREGVVRGPRL